MPITQTVVYDITCDNPDCPGNELDPHDRTGWLIINSEVHPPPDPLTPSMPTMNQHVFCSVGCVNTATATSPELLTGMKEEVVTP